MISTQGGAALAKDMFPALGAVGTASLRICLSAILLLTIFRPSMRLTAAQWKAVVPYGIGMGVMNLAFYQALSRIPLGLAVTVEFIGPLAVAVLGSRRALDLLWVVLAATGIVFITPWSGVSAASTEGVLFALFAGACWAIYIVVGGRVSQLFRAGDGVATGMLFAIVVVLPFSVGSPQLRHLTPELAAKGLGVAMLSSALPFWLEMTALRKMPARTFGILMSVEPAIGALSGRLFLGEHLSGKQWLSLALVTLATAGSSLTARKSEMRPEA